MKKLLQCPNSYAITDTLGGELVSFRSGGIEYVWTGNSEFWNGHAPVLFPNVGELKDGAVVFGAREYHIPKHGIARKRQFKLLDADDTSVHFLLCADEETKSQYPFDFELHIIHTLYHDGFSTEYRVVNPGKEPMPFCLGGHAGFCCPLYANESFEDYCIRFSEQEHHPFHYTDENGLYLAKTIFPLQENGTILPLNYQVFNNDVLILDRVASRKLELYHTRTQKGLSFEFHGFSALGLWTPPGKRAPFLCLEPWNGLPASEQDPGVFEQKPYVVTLAPNESYTAGYCMHLLG